MNFISTINGGFDTNLPISECLPDLEIQTEDQLLDKVFKDNLFVDKVMGIGSKKKKATISERIKTITTACEAMEKKIRETNYKTKEEKFKDVGLLLCMEEFMGD